MVGLVGVVIYVVKLDGVGVFGVVEFGGGWEVVEFLCGLVLVVVGDLCCVWLGDGVSLDGG